MPLIYISAPNYYYTYELPATPGAEIYIGTSPQCQLSLPGVEGLAEVHARIACQPQGYVLSDMGTPYGTLANGVPIQADYLRPGVEYRMGSLVISLPAEAQQMGGAPQQQSFAAAAQQPAAAAKKPGLKKKSVGVKTAGAAKGGKSKVDLEDMADRFKRKGGDSPLFNMIYVLVLIVAAVYAGIALHHWQKTGNYLPGIVTDGGAEK